MNGSNSTAANYEFILYDFSLKKICVRGAMMLSFSFIYDELLAALLISHVKHASIGCHRIGFK
jgi:hypothetical protein